MSNGIFFIDKDDNLVEMLEKSYDSEDLLQRLLAKYPNLISGGQIDKANPRRWLLVSREVQLPDSGDGPGRWAVDHLFLDQDAIPTIIEVKRSSDTRIRRELVGQMLDYAANAVVYWSVEKLQNLFEENCKSKNLDPEIEINNFLENSVAVEDFWKQVKTNLQAGKVRLIFVADMIPSELQRIVEFLNEQMDPAEVLAFEIKQFLGKDATRTLIPRIIGQTAEAQKRKGESKPKIDRQIFLENVDEYIKNFFINLFNFSEENEMPIHWGTAGFSLNIDLNGNHVNILYGYSNIATGKQSIYTAVMEIKRKVRNHQEVIGPYFNNLKQTGLFKPAGNEIKWIINKPISSEQQNAIFDALLKVKKNIENN